MTLGDSLSDMLRCKTCGSAFRFDKDHTAKTCPECDRAYRGNNGETNDGGTFGDLLSEQIKFEYIRNAQMSEYAGNLRELTAGYMRCKEFIRKLEHPVGRMGPRLTPHQVHDFANLFNMANIARYYICVQLKETADILVDTGLVRKGEDPLQLGREGKSGKAGW